MVACRLLGFAGQIVDLVHAIERRLDEPGILTGLEPLLQCVALRPAGDLDERREPVEGGKHFVLDGAGLDDAAVAA
jgi:hypothetical protein